MADYREISQEYAQGAIKATSLLNGGAAVAVGSQFVSMPSAVSQAVVTSMIIWIVGVTLGAAVWAVAFASTRYVDKYMDENVGSHLDVSNKLMHAGLTMIALSFIAFLVGATNLALAYQSILVCL
jgi:hypothetical protein